MRVHIVGAHFAPEPTPVSQLLTRIATGLASRGHQVRCTTTFPHEPRWRVGLEWSGWSRREFHGGVDVRRVKHFVPFDPVGLPQRVSELSFGLRAVATGWGRPDVVLCLNASPGVTSLILARAKTCGIPVGVLVHEPLQAGAPLPDGAIARRYLDVADGVAVVHDATRLRLVSRLGLDDERIAVLAAAIAAAGSDDQAGDRPSEMALDGYETWLSTLVG